MHIGDRESDIYELFCEASKLGTHFLVRTCVDRLAVDGKRTVAAEMARVPAAGMHRIEVTALNNLGVAAIWELHLAAARAYRNGNKPAAWLIAEIADAAEREWLRRRAGSHG